MFELYYKKNKNNDLFKSSKEVVNIETIQNYIPIYKKFFSLNEDNFNSINLNENEPIQSIVEKKGLYLSSKTRYFKSDCSSGVTLPIRC